MIGWSCKCNVWDCVDREQTYHLCGVVLWFTSLLYHSALSGRANSRWFTGRAELERKATGGAFRRRGFFINWSQPNPLHDRNTDCSAKQTVNNVITDGNSIRLMMSLFFQITIPFQSQENTLSPWEYCISGLPSWHKCSALVYSQTNIDNVL